MHWVLVFFAVRGENSSNWACYSDKTLKSSSKSLRHGAYKLKVYQICSLVWSTFHCSLGRICTTTMSPFSALLRATIPSRNISRVSSCNIKTDCLSPGSLKRFTSNLKEYSLIQLPSYIVYTVYCRCANKLAIWCFFIILSTENDESNYFWVELTGDGMKASWYFFGLIRNCPCRERMDNLEISSQTSCVIHFCNNYPCYYYSRCHLLN